MEETEIRKFPASIQNCWKSEEHMGTTEGKNYCNMTGMYDCPYQVTTEKVLGVAYICRLREAQAEEKR